MKIAFCTPVMNRLEDIKSTLHHNISVVAKFRGNVSLYINCFDKDDFLHFWVKSNFQFYLNNNTLKFNKIKPLDFWHFSNAKNSFSKIISEDYYSSLDGDNFLSDEEISETLELINSCHPVVFHGFSGNWGDGSSGRLTIPTEYYRKYGYLSRILPRQFDEMGLISNILANEPDATYVSYCGVNIMALSRHMSKWIELNDIDINHFEIPHSSQMVPMNPKGSSYVKRSDILTFYQMFNAAYTYLHLSRGIKSSEWYAKELRKAVTSVKPHVAVDAFSHIFETERIPTLSSEMTLYAVIKDDIIFLKKWIVYYKKLGVKRFIIVNDDSSEDIKKFLDDENIYIFNPLVGDFKSCKALWLQILLKLYQCPESWFITVDSDEFLCLENFSNSLNNYCSYLESKGYRFGSGLLVDMLPNRDATKSELLGSDFQSIYGRFYMRPPTGNFAYQNHHSIRWAFGAYWQYSHQIDARYRFFQTIDSLRKIPIIKYDYDIELNQGFHGLSFGDKSISVDKIFAHSDIIIPVFHYKYTNIFIGKLSDRNFSAYHDRTNKNLKRIISKSVKDLHREINFSPYVYKFSIEKFNSIFL